MSERDVLELDCVVVGAGPAGLAAALRFQELSGGAHALAVLEKASTPGLHSLSGAVVDPRALDELLPDWRKLDPPVESPVTKEAMYALSERRAYRIPVPPPMHNRGNFVCSLNRLVEWLAKTAESRGVEIFAEFPARDLLFDRPDGDRVTGVRLVDSGVGKDGARKASYQPGADVRAKVTILCDGVRGNLTKQLVQRIPGVLEGRNPADYETGVKELWRVRDGAFPAGKVVHTMGWPLPPEIYGGSWIYGMRDNLVSLGLVMGLDYEDPTWDLHREFTRWKTHPWIARLLDGGEIVRYGAKAIPGGGLYSMPRLWGDGWLLAGDAAGSVNMARLKGVHLAIKTGMLAGEAAYRALTSGTPLQSYDDAFRASWAFDELHKTRNFRTTFKVFRRPRAIFEVAVQTLLSGRGLFYGRLAAGESTLGPPRPPPAPPPYDNKTTFEKLTDVYHSGTKHEEDQPCHLVVREPDLCVSRCTREYGNPCNHFCPAGVYEFRGSLTINASNCVHCKTCDIKDPYGIIDWVTPEGGGGPHYTLL